MEQRGLRADTAFIRDLEAGKLTGAYLLYGQEPYFMDRAVKKAEALLGDAAKDMNYTLLTGPTAEQVINACEQLPFFDQRRLVVVRELSAEAGAALGPYVMQIPQTSLLLLLRRGGTPPKARKPSNKPASGKKAGKPASAGDPLLEALAAAGRAVEFAPYDQIDAARFAAACAKRDGAQLERPEAAMLVDMLGCDLNTLEQGLKKAEAYVGRGGRVTPEAIRACITPNTAYKVYELTDKLAAGDKKAALNMLHTLLKNGESPIGIANYLEGRCKVMLEAVEQLNAGRREQDALSSIGGNPNAAKYTLRNAKRLGAQRLIGAVIDLGQVSARQIAGMMSDRDALFLALMKNF